MREQGYVVAPLYSQSQPRMGGFSKSFGPPNSSLCYGHYDDPNSSYAAPQPGMSKSTVPLESSATVGPPPPGTHQFSQTRTGPMQWHSQRTGPGTTPSSHISSGHPASFQGPQPTPLTQQQMALPPGSSTSK